MEKPQKPAARAANSPTASVTGRDGYIINKALAYAISTIRALPKEQREESDAEDMLALLEHLVPSVEQRLYIFRGVLDHMDRDRLFMTPRPIPLPPVKLI